MLPALLVQDALLDGALTGSPRGLDAGHNLDSAAVGATVRATTAAGPAAAVPERAHYQGTAAVESILEPWVT